MNTMDKIQEKTLNMKITEEKRIRELVRVTPHSTMATVKSENAPGELLGKYSAWFKTPVEASSCDYELSKGKTVLVTIKEIEGRWSIIKSEIRTPNVDIPESSLEEQHKEMEALGNDY